MACSEQGKWGPWGPRGFQCPAQAWVKDQESITLSLCHFKSPEKFQETPCQAVSLVLSLSPFYSWGN